MMLRLTDYPVLLALAALAAMSAASLLGLWVRRRRGGEGPGEDFGVVSAATLTLLALLIGFTFSMASERYGQRKTLEEEEANAIGTEYLRVELMPAPLAAEAQAGLKAYLHERILYFTTADRGPRKAADARADALEKALWTDVKSAAAAAPTPVMATVTTGMNDVFNARGYSEAAFRNRIPPAAWLLTIVIAVYANALLGYGAKDAGAWRSLALLLPLAVAASILLICDIDAPRRGLIKVAPQNLESLAASLRP